MKVISLTATQVDDNAANKNGYSAASSVEVVAQVLTAGDGTTKDVIQVWSPSHFSFANPNSLYLAFLTLPPNSFEIIWWPKQIPKIGIFQLNICLSNFTFLD